MNTNDTLARTDELLTEIDLHLFRAKASNKLATIRHHSHEARVRLEELKTILQGDSVVLVSDSDLDGTGFRLIAQPVPSSDCPGYLDRGMTVELKTFRR